jgi:hypothetical protein
MIKKKRKKKKVLKDLDPKIKELEKKKEKEAEEAEEPEEELEQYTEDLWEELLHEEEKEAEDAFNPEGLILKSGQKQENLQQRLEGSVATQAGQRTDNTPRGNTGEIYSQGGSGGGDIYNQGITEGGDLYNAGGGEGNLYNAGQEGSSLYGPNSQESESKNLIYTENMGTNQDNETRVPDSALESTDRESSDRKDSRFYQPGNQ